MTALIIDTSSENSLVGISEGKSLLYAFIAPHGNNLSRSLLPSILEALEKTTASLDYIAAGMGPGSYTGTRVGATVAKTLSFAWNIPLIPFCSLLCFLPEIKGRFGCLMPAKSGNCYLLKGDLKNEKVSITLSSLLEPEETFAACRDCDYIATSHSSTLPDPFSSASFKRIDFQPNLKAPTLYALNEFLLGNTLSSHAGEMIYLHSPS